MEQQPAPKDNKRTITIILVVLGALVVVGGLCCVGLGFGVFKGISGAEKTYYLECVDLDDAEACEACCRERGHSGYVYGTFINEEGKNCGCL